MDDMKRCFKCKMDCLKTNFHKHKKKKRWRKTNL